MLVKIPVSIGELYDKISILQIKLARIGKDKNKEYVTKELYSLLSVAKDNNIHFESDDLFYELKAINSGLWVIEEQKRLCEAEKKFDKFFIHLARQVYLKNDERAALKAKINEKYNSEIREVKSY